MTTDTTTHKPTFKKSKDKRSWHKRLTPVAWALIIVVLLATAACAAAGAWRLSRDRDQPFELTPTATPVVTTGPSLTSEPSPTPTVWYDGMVTPTVTATAAAGVPAWWSDQMTQDDDGNWWPPQEVIEDIKAAYNTDYEAGRTYLVDTKPPDYDAREEAMREWCTGPALEARLELLAARRAGEVSIRFADWEVCIPQVQEFTPDGLQCTLGIVCRDGVATEYDPLTGEFIGEEHVAHSGLALLRMHYDPRAGHWKRYDMVEYVPPPSE